MISIRHPIFYYSNQFVLHYKFVIIMHICLYALCYRYKLPASIVKLFALWKSTWCALCTKKKLLNALLEKWRRFETLRTNLLTFLSEANNYCNPPFEQLGMMTSLMDIDDEMKNFKVSSYIIIHAICLNMYTTASNYV